MNFKLFFILVLLAVLGMGVAWQRVRVMNLGYAVNRLEQKKLGLQEQNRKLLLEINSISAADKMMKLAREGKVTLVEPSHLVWLESGGAGSNPVDKEVPRVRLNPAQGQSRATRSQ